MDDKPICIRCGEDFPIADEPTIWHMGWMRPATKLPKKLQQKVGYRADDMRGKPHLCGNCYFDLTDDE